MKKMMIKTTNCESQKKTTEIPAVNLASDFFKCRKCGYTVRMLVRGDIAHCSQCGGTMDRI